MVNEMLILSAVLLIVVSVGCYDDRQDPIQKSSKNSEQIKVMRAPKDDANLPIDQVDTKIDGTKLAMGKTDLAKKGTHSAKNDANLAHHDRGLYRGKANNKALHTEEDKQKRKLSRRWPFFQNSEKSSQISPVVHGHYAQVNHPIVHQHGTVINEAIHDHHVVQPVVHQQHVVQPIVHQQHVIQPVVHQQHVIQPIVHVKHIMQAEKPQHIVQPIVHQQHVVQPVIHQQHIIQPVIHKQHVIQPVIHHKHVVQPIIHQQHVVQPVIHHQHIMRPVIQHHPVMPVPGSPLNTSVMIPKLRGQLIPNVSPGMNINSVANSHVHVNINNGQATIDDGGGGSPVAGPCASGPCMNGGTCVDEPSNAFSCLCPNPSSGALCQITSYDYCVKCINGDCAEKPTYDETKLVCNCGRMDDIMYTGKYCDQKDPCSPNPCLNDGTCEAVAVLGKYHARCVCPYEWELEHCQDENWCKRPQRETGLEPQGTGMGPCSEYAVSCIDSDYVPEQNRPEIEPKVLCICTQPSELWTQADYMGKYCEVRNPCHNITCQNGYCEAHSELGSGGETTYDWTCVCNEGYGGPYCESPNPCIFEKPCQNNGECYWWGPGSYPPAQVGQAYMDEHRKEYHCCCPKEWFGENCTHESACHPNKKYSCAVGEFCYLVVTKKWSNESTIDRNSTQDLSTVDNYKILGSPESTRTTMINHQCNFGFYSNYDMEKTMSDYITRDDEYGRQCYSLSDAPCTSNPCDYNMHGANYSSCVDDGGGKFHCECNNCDNENNRLSCYKDNLIYPVNLNGCSAITDAEIEKWAKCGWTVC